METIIDDLKDWLGYGRKPIKRIKTMEINDLAIGKWYRVDDIGYMKPLILKTSSLKADIINLLQHTNKFGSNSEVLNCSWWQKAVLLTDLDEIQTYFPDGYIDKIEKSYFLEKDKWYTGEGNEKWLFKYTGFQQGFTLVGMSKCCIIPSGEKTMSSGSLQNIKNVKLADMEEVYKYFPEEKPKNLTNKDMIIGELYKYDKHIILRFKGILEITQCLFTVGDKLYTTSWQYTLHIEIPSEEEKKWYIACENASKFIPKEEALKEKLFTFPINGSCNTIDERLINFLKNRQSGRLIGSERNSYSAGIGWNSSNYWYFANSSEKPLYSIKDLEPFLKDVYVENKPMEIKELTSLPEKWCIRAVDNAQFALIKPYFMKLKPGLYDNYLVTYPDNGWSNDNTSDYYSTHIQYHLTRGCIEITLDQFKKWVLKDDFKIGDWVISDSYETCILKKNIPYKIVDVIGNTLYLTIGSHERISYGSINFRKALLEEIPKLPSMEPINEDWCVKFDKLGNGEAILYWAKGLDSYYYSVEQFSYNYYGIKGNRFDKSGRSWGKLLTAEEFYEKIGKSTPKKEENLVGRYLKALKDSPQSTALKKGDYLLITKTSSPNNGIGIFSSNIWHWDYNSTTKGISWELMSEGFIPPKEQECRFTVGKWYKNIGDYNFIAKFGKMSGTCFCSLGGYIDKDKYLNHGTDDKLSSNLSRVVECPIEEISHLLPEGHVDKIKPNVMEEFKVGDWIVIEAWVGVWSSCAGGEYPAKATYPMTVKIENIVTTNNYTGLYDGKYGHSLIALKEKNLIRKALPHEIPNNQSNMQTFKIGDKVRCIGNDSKNSSGWKKGLEFIITGLYPDNDKATLGYGGNGGNGVYFDQLELVTSSIPEYVECLRWGGFSHKTGKIYRVVNGKIESELSGTPTTWIGEDSGGGQWKISTKEAYLDQSHPKMSEGESLIEKAKRLYPVGTKFKLINQEEIVTVEKPVYINPNNIIWNGNGYGRIYDGSTNQWAEIVSVPKNAYITGIDPYESNRVQNKPSILIDIEVGNINISDVFKSKKSAKMSYIAENYQISRQLGKVVKSKYVTI